MLSLCKRKMEFPALQTMETKINLELGLHDICKAPRCASESLEEPTCELSPPRPSKKPRPPHEPPPAHVLLMNRVPTPPRPPRKCASLTPLPPWRESQSRSWSNERVVKVSDLFFSQTSIRHNFKNGKTLKELVDELLNGKVHPLYDKFLRLEVVCFDGKLHSLNNRRLKCLKIYQEKVDHVVLAKVAVREPGINGGADVMIREPGLGKVTWEHWERTSYEQTSYSKVTWERWERTSYAGG